MDNKTKLFCTLLFIIFGILMLLQKIEFTFKDDATIQFNSFPPMKPTRNRSLLCYHTGGGLGNEIFQFASAFGISKIKNMSVVISEHNKVAKIFKLKVDVSKSTRICDTLPNITAKGCMFNRDLLNLDNSHSYKIIGCLQSWRYFIDYENELREMLTFRDHIWMEAYSIRKNVLDKYSNNYSSSNITLVGIHIRRGDKVTDPGFRTATKEYFQKAINFYTNRYKDIVFIVASNGMDWSKSNLPRNVTIHFLSTDNTPELDMAVLSLCNHVIQSVGTFSWWSAWLANGTSIFFKWPIDDGSYLEKIYSKNFWDHFWPTRWIGMDEKL